MKIKFTLFGLFCAAMLLGTNSFVLAVGSDDEQNRVPKIVIPEEVNNSGSETEDDYTEEERQDSEKNNPYKDEEVNNNEIVQKSESESEQSEKEEADVNESNNNSENEEERTEEVVEEFKEEIQNNNTLSDKEKEKVQEKVEEIEDVNIALTDKEIAGTGLSKEVMKKYLKQVVDGGAIFTGGIVLYLTFTDPANLACLKFACAHDKAIQMIVDSSLSLLVTYAGIKGWPSTLLDKICAGGKWGYEQLKNLLQKQQIIKKKKAE